MNKSKLRNTINNILIQQQQKNYKIDNWLNNFTNDDKIKKRIKKNINNGLRQFYVDKNNGDKYLFANQDRSYQLREQIIQANENISDQKKYNTVGETIMQAYDDIYSQTGYFYYQI